MASNSADGVAARIAELELQEAQHREALGELRRRLSSISDVEERRRFSGEIAEREAALQEIEEQLAELRGAEEEPERGPGRLARAAGALGGAAGAAAGAATDAFRRRGGGRQGASRTGGGLGGLYNRADDRFRKAQDDAAAAIAGTAKAFDRHGHPLLFALFALLLHAWDAINGFARGGGQHTLLMITAYGLLALYAALAYYRTGLSRESLRFFGVSLAALLLPFIFQLPLIGPYLRGYPLLLTLLLAMPVWFLYIALHEPEESRLRTLGKWWVYALALFLFIIALGMVTLPDALGSETGVLLGQSLRTTWQQFTESWDRVGERFGALFNAREWRQRINQTFNPYAAYYQGQVEENRREPHGVQITRFEPLYPRSYAGTEAVVQGRLEAKSFLDEDVRITPSCRLERADRSWPGIPEPRNPFDVNLKLVRDVLCTYPLGENMTPGGYTAVLGATFDFETWAYITNTFVARELFEQHYAQEQDINEALDIPRTTTAVYTNGPVAVGVSATEQPIDIDPEASSPIQQRFGFTIENRWPQGEIREVYAAEAIVPEPFRLEECLPTPPAATREEEGTTVYTFEGIDSEAPYDYRTVTCRLTLPGRAAAEEVLAFGEKTPVTFVVTARYRYQIEEEARLRVEP